MMIRKRILCIPIIGAVLLGGCSINRQMPPSLEPPSQLLESPSEDSPSGDSPALSGQQDGICVYENKELGLAIKYLVASPGKYLVTFGGQSEEFEIGYSPEEIRTMTVEPWGSDSLFLVCRLTSAGGDGQCFILNSEMFSEVMLADPAETAMERLDWEIVERGGALWLSVNQEISGISAKDRETLEMLGHNLRPMDDFKFHSGDSALLCDVPLTVDGDETVGCLRLSYEYDGVGMNCIHAEYIP